MKSLGVLNQFWSAMHKGIALLSNNKINLEFQVIVYLNF
jgi:hypothetical protein